jgi:chromosome segregation ATPase
VLEPFLVKHLGVCVRVVETVMIFALGFLAATLIALLIIPAINARAERLARRRAEALFPLSISELTAEKDHLRAEFAVLQRRIERKAEEALAVKHQSMKELGRQAIRIEALEGTVAERDATVMQLQTDLENTQSQLTATEDELSQTKAFLGGSRETLIALEKAHRATLDELSNTRRELENAQADLIRTRGEMVRTSEKLNRREMDFTDADGRLTAALSELDAKRITISSLETRLMTQKARGDDFERALGERHSELSDERQRLAQLAKSLTAEQERGLILEQHIREIEAERDEARARADALSGLEAQNEELRRRITEVADQIMRNGAPRPQNKSQNGKRRKSASK